ncbi:MAG: hypothetical protein B7Z08_08075 [Sphingomonadales bacterium 32-68-7]|nr:MAG: hypothetical protein B7Z33_12050 [Sphingomonadales bacterium 12-68-11]OYX08772.1 MAG: hypothetical protein B7Z08_08075 [Sphingomonadales bacterium 32-68-7]
MPRMNIRAIKFAKVYPMYVQKAERKGRTQAEVDELIRWLTGYSDAGLSDQIVRETDFETFFAEAPELHPKRGEIKGLICGYRVEDIADPFEQTLRQLDKIIDELAKGKAMEKIKRA